MTTAAQRARLTLPFRELPLPMADDRIERRIAAAAGRAPRHPALRWRAADGGWETLSYGDLAARMRDGAGHLAGHCGGVVGVMMPRSHHRIVVILSILAAGAAYLPLDPGQPIERLRYMIDSSGCGLVVTDTAQAAGLAKHGVKAWIPGEALPANNSARAANPVAAIIFTWGPGQARWLQQLRDERRNIDAALLWARRRTDIDPDLGLRLVAAMGWFWYFTSNQDAAKVIDVMLSHPAGGSARARALAIQARSIVARPGSCIVHPSPGCAQDARDSLLQSLDRLGERHRAAYSATLLAVEACGAPAASDELLRTARDAFHQANDQWGHALTLFVEMELLFAARNLEQGRAVFHAALEQFRDLGDHWGISAVQYHYALALHRGGLPTEAMQAYRSALAEGRIGLTNTVRYAVANLGHLSLMIGDLDGADAYFSSAHTVARDLGADISVLAAIGQGHLARLRGDTREAADRYQTALNWIKEADTPDWAATALTGLGHIALEQGDPDAAHSHHSHALQLVTVDNEPRYPAAAAALEGLARVAASRGLERTTRALLRRAAHYRRTQAVPPTPLERQDLETAHQSFADTETPAAHPSV